MNRQNWLKQILYLSLTLLFVLSLAACKGQADEQDSQPPSPTITPTEAPTPTPEPTPPIPYTDVSSDASYYDAVVWAYQNGIASDGTTFDPASACTRGQVVTSLWRAMGSPEPQTTENPISDIASDDWYYKPALWAYESGIITNTTFNPGNPCTNAEIITILWRAYGEPAAAVYSSAVSLANSGKYYTRAVAWADNGGMFAGMDSTFDPAAPCSRADLMMYLYWATEQWTFTEEDKAIQAEYEQIIKDAQLYEVHGSGLLFADYVDIDGDGMVELLTVGINEDKFKGTVIVYANIDGHAKKSCEGTFDTALGNRVAGFSLCNVDGYLYLSSDGWIVEGAGAYYQNIFQFHKIEKEAVTLEYDLYNEEEYIFERDTTEYTYTASGRKITEEEFKTILQKFTDEKLLYSHDCYGGVISISDRGLLPIPGVEVNGVVVKLSSAPYSSNNTSAWSAIQMSSNYRPDWFMVPLRDVLEAMGVAVYANSDASVILASTKSDTLVISNLDYPFYYGIVSPPNYGHNNTYRYYMNGSEHKDIAVEFIGGKAFVPLQTIVSLFGATVEWSGETGTMQITSNIPDSNRMSQTEINTMANFTSDEAIRIGKLNGFEVLYVGGKLRIEHGRSIWDDVWVVKEYYVKDEWSEYGLIYPIEVTSSGSITAHPEREEYYGAGQY